MHLVTLEDLVQSSGDRAFDWTSWSIYPLLYFNTVFNRLPSIRLDFLTIYLSLPTILTQVTAKPINRTPHIWNLTHTMRMFPVRGDDTPSHRIKSSYPCAIGALMMNCDNPNLAFEIRTFTMSV